MRVTIVTLFPDLFDGLLKESLIGKAIEAGHLRVDFQNPRDFTTDRHRTVDDTPYGGGAGMVMKAPPVLEAIRAAGDGHRILMAPSGTPLVQSRARELAKKDHLVLVCGRYEGIDERVRDLAIDEALSVGDFVLNGGEVAAMCVIEAVSRLVPGVIGREESQLNESFEDGVLEHPHYTRPPEVEGRAVPEVLLSGDHGRIAAWRRTESVARTAKERPDMLRGLTDKEHPLAALAARTSLILAHHPVYDGKRDVVTTAVTNLDVHDIARSSKTYGLARYYLVTPVAAQREKIDRILGVWAKGERQQGGSREEALSLAVCVDSIETALRALENPVVVATTADAARARPEQRVSPEGLIAEMLATPDRPFVLLFGTGWGLTDEVMDQSDRVLTPVGGTQKFRHLSVRSACAIVLDRLFGLHS